MEGVSETRLFPLFGCECFDGFEVKVVVQMEVVETLSVNEEIEHVVPLATDLQTGFDPINFGRLEEFCRLELFEEIFFVESFGWPFVEGVENVALEEFLVGHAD